MTDYKHFEQELKKWLLTNYDIDSTNMRFYEKGYVGKDKKERKLIESINKKVPAAAGITGLCEDHLILSQIILYRKMNMRLSVPALYESYLIGGWDLIKKSINESIARAMANTNFMNQRRNRQ